MNEKESRNNDLENMKKGLRNTYKFTLRVKSNLPEYRRFVAMPKAEVRRGVRQGVRGVRRGVRGVRRGVRGVR